MWECLFSTLTPTLLPGQTMGERRVNSGLWHLGSCSLFTRSHSRAAQRLGRTGETPRQPPRLWLKEATSSGVRPPWKATGNSALAEARPPRPGPSSSASCSKGQRAGCPCGAVDPRLSRAPLPSQVIVRLHPPAPKASADVPQPLSGPHCSLLPSTISLCLACPVAPRDTQERKLSLPRGCKVGMAQERHGPPAKSTGQQGNANKPSASHFGQRTPSSPAPGLPAPLGQGLPPSLH